MGLAKETDPRTKFPADAFRTPADGRIRFRKRLGSESKVASRSLTWLHKASASCTTYPTAYPGPHVP
jgi:hypothetical protein